MQPSVARPDPRVSTSLVGAVAGATNGSSIARKTSFLRDKMGQQILARGLALERRPPWAGWIVEIVAPSPS